MSREGKISVFPKPKIDDEMATTVLATSPYAEQMQNWPQTGQHILAQFDDETIIVYQAFCPSIARFAIENGLFGAGFSYSRMSWIKTNFLWMMHRSQWGTAGGQEIVLAVRLRRRFFDSLLAQAVASSFDPQVFDSRQNWADAVARSDVRLQWDPDHLPTGQKRERRAIQLGLRRAALEACGKREIVQIIDMSDFVAEQRPHIREWKNCKLRTPIEGVYLPNRSLRKG
jgi:hypothetical protein